MTEDQTNEVAGQRTKTMKPKEAKELSRSDPKFKVVNLPEG